eukprot:30925-Pelagococcus_subviridis.AAC.8
MGGEKRRAKSLRNGVHHANAVVWEPVYRTHLNLRGHRRRKEQRLMRRREVLHHLSNLRLEPHVQHAIRLVQDHERNAPEVRVTLMQVVDEATGRRDAHLDALTEVRSLVRHVRASDDDGRLEPLAAPGEHLRLLLDLLRELSGRGHDDRERAVAALDRVLLEAVLNHRDAKRGGLARARLGAAEDVAAAEDDRDRLRLDRRRLVVLVEADVEEDLRVLRRARRGRRKREEERRGRSGRDPAEKEEARDATSRRKKRAPSREIGEVVVVVVARDASPLRATHQHHVFERLHRRRGLVAFLALHGHVHASSNLLDLIHRQRLHALARLPLRKDRGRVSPARRRRGEVDLAAASRVGPSVVVSVAASPSVVAVSVSAAPVVVPRAAAVPSVVATVRAAAIAIARIPGPAAAAAAAAVAVASAAGVPGAAAQVRW